MPIFGGNSEQLNIIIKARDDASKTLNQFNDRVAKTEQNFRRMAIGGSVAFAAIGTAVGKAVSEASKAQEIERTFSAVFDETEGNMRDWVSNISREFGRVESDIQKIAATSAGVLVPAFDISEQKIAEMTQGLAESAIALAAYDPRIETAQQAMEGFTQALIGNRARVLDWGFQVREAQLQAEGLERGIIRAGDSLTQQQKALLTYQLIVENTSIAQQVLKDSQQDWAEQMKRLKSRTQELAQTIGDLFLDDGTDVLVKVRDIVDSINNWIEEHKSLTKFIIISAGSLAGFVATVGTLGLVVTSITRVIIAARAAFIALRVAIVALSGPVGILIAGVTALAGVLGFKYFTGAKSAEDGTTSLKDEVNNLEASLKDTLPSTDDLAKGIENIGNSATESLKKLKDLKKEGLDVIQQVAKDEQTFNERAAEAIIDQEEKIQDIKEQIRRAESQEGSKQNDRELSRLYNQLEEEKAALRSHSDLKKRLTEEVQEARRRAELTDFERTIENLMRQRVARLKEHVNNLQRIVEERNAAFAKDNAVGQSFFDTQDKIQEKAAETAENQKLQFKVMVDNAYTAANAINNAFGRSQTTPALPNFKSAAAPEGATFTPTTAGSFSTSTQPISLPSFGSNSNSTQSINVNINNPVMRDRDDVNTVKFQVEEALRSVVRNNKLQTI